MIRFIYLFIYFWYIYI